MNQKSLTFTPHILPILKGTTVNFLNSDSVAHNVFSPDETADKMDLGTWQRDQVRSYTFRKSGIVSLLCNLHPEMSAYIVVLNNPYFTKTQKDGKFLIAAVPPGTYTIMAWHGSRKGQSKEIVVSDNKAYVNFILR
ncbi:MAG: plastocyanin/azurin family copper-binding protein [Candidatus Scalindua sp.]